MRELAERIGYPMFIQVIAESWTEIFLLLLISTMLIGIKRDKTDAMMSRVEIPMTRELIIFYAALFVYSLSDIMDITLGAQPTIFSRYVISIGVFIYYLSGGFQTVFFIQVLKKHIAEKNGFTRLKKLLTAFQIGHIPLFLILLLTPFTDILYYIDSSNDYTRSWGYWIWQSYTALSFTFMAGVIIACWKKTEPFMKKIIITGTVFPLLAFAGNLFIKGVSLNNIMIGISAIVMFILYERNKTRITVRSIFKTSELHEELHRKEMELEKSKLNLLMSQIKPHFINNAMIAMQELCYEDPIKAADLIKHFSLYLRSNIRATNGENPILFMKELQAIKEYLAIEYADTSKKFSFEFDLKCTEFLVPALSVEPLAENAVKHGIDRYSDKSKVVLSTYEDDEAYHVLIKDNGSGFEINDETLGKGGIGLSNTIKRLELMCGGRLDIGRKDGWTTAHMIIPKNTEGEKHADNNDR